MKNETLIIAAHPDDEILWCWWYISKYSKNENIHVLIITDWSSNQYKDEKYIKIKMNQVKLIQKQLWIREYHWWNLPDMKLDTIPHIKINNIITKHINKIKPSKIFTHHWWDINLDHKMIFDSTIVAARPNNSIKEILCYEVPSASEWDNRDSNCFIPNYFEEISKWDVENKINALKKYETEIRPHPHPRSLESMKIYAQFRWTSICKKFAESYYLYRKII